MALPMAKFTPGQFAVLSHIKKASTRFRVEAIPCNSILLLQSERQVDFCWQVPVSKPTRQEGGIDCPTNVVNPIVQGDQTRSKRGSCLQGSPIYPFTALDEGVPGLLTNLTAFCHSPHQPQRGGFRIRVRSLRVSHPSQGNWQGFQVNVLGVPGFRHQVITLDSTKQFVRIIHAPRHTQHPITCA